MFFLKLFYFIRPLIPRSIQLSMRKKRALHLKKKYANIWPIDETAGKKPPNWKGWPDNKKFAFAVAHDVDTPKGLENCLKLAELDKSLGIRSTFYFVPEMRYESSRHVRTQLLDQGFDIGIHGLKHDGKLFWSKKRFQKAAQQINSYLQDWNTKAFSSPSMHHNLEWMHELNIDYGTSTFDTDPFEPQPDSVGTIFPFYVRPPNGNNGYIEIPLTLAQDFTLFVVLEETGIDIWKKKVDWIAQRGGMALINVHPDYMNFNHAQNGTEEYPVGLYESFISYVKKQYNNQCWITTVSDIAGHVQTPLQKNMWVDFGIGNSPSL